MKTSLQWTRLKCNTYINVYSSTLLASQYGEVNQSLAALIRWSDSVILQEPMKVNKQQGTDAIAAVKAATEVQ